MARIELCPHHGRERPSHPQYQSHSTTAIKRIKHSMKNNEKENISLIIETVFALPKDFHVLIVDDGSDDKTRLQVLEHSEVQEGSGVLLCVSQSHPIVSGLSNSADTPRMAQHL